ncbi:hypothetical protein SAMN05421664_3607 [Chryseobacterium soldanellicola]|uniref:Uncharacterized protein n=1 Tax=Chryseobacterium soldanellicola TaxID=311333 RepID=A0A1H1GDN7_9FLAO|nr:hypothetical protein [Chryseobacterium soldanellicola]SDR11225.1 hypothetical protein SAMN05421664_3607 [Chryseobacterium soldanellicola]
MKTILSLSLVAGFLVLSCKKETENKTYNSADSLSTADTTTTVSPPSSTADTMATDTARQTENSKINAANSTPQKDTVTTKK